MKIRHASEEKEIVFYRGKGVDSLKLQIQQHTKIPSEKQKLFYVADNILKRIDNKLFAEDGNDLTLKDIGLKERNLILVEVLQLFLILKEKEEKEENDNNEYEDRKAMEDNDPNLTKTTKRKKLDENDELLSVLVDTEEEQNKVVRYRNNF